MIYTGLRRTSQQIVDTVRDEDARFLGLSSLSGAHAHLFPQVCEKLREAGLDDVIVFGGGIIPDEDRPALHEVGIRAVFGPGTPTAKSSGTSKRPLPKTTQVLGKAATGIGNPLHEGGGGSWLSELQLALDGDRRAMARLLSAIENGAVSVDNILGSTSSIESKAWSTMAITGAPGVGKSVLVTP